MKSKEIREIISVVITACLLLTATFLLASSASDFLGNLDEKKNINQSMSVVDEKDTIEEKTDVIYYESLDSNAVDKLLSSGEISATILTPEYKLDFAYPIERTFYIKKEDTYYEVRSTSTIKDSKGTFGVFMGAITGVLIGIFITVTIGKYINAVLLYLIDLILKRLDKMRDEVRFDY